MGKLTILFGLLILLAAIYVYNLIIILEFFKKVSLKNKENCNVIRGAIGMEDLIKYKNYLISGSNDNGKLWERKEYILKTPNGKMVVIDTSKDVNNLKIEDLIVNNFPIDIAFHPHGLALYKNKFIYAINHAYNKGGERVEVFEIVEKSNKLELNHLRSILMPDHYAGIFNSLTVIGDNDEFLITTYLPFPDNNEKGRQTDFFNTIRLVSVPALGLKWTYIYHCKGNQCEIVPGSESVISNGITYDTRNKKVYSFNGSKEGNFVYKWSFNQNSDKNLLFLEKNINVGFSVDNLKYDEKTGLITAGIVGRVGGHLDVIEHIKKYNGSLGGDLRNPSGSLQIDTLNDDKVEVLVMQDDKFYGIATSVRIENLIYHSSWVDDGILVCEV